MQYGYDLDKIDTDKQEDPYLEDLESRLRACLQQHRDNVLRMTCDEATSRQRFIAQLVERVAEAGALESYYVSSESMTASFIKIASVDVDVKSVHGVLRSFFGDDRFEPFWRTTLGDCSPDEAFSDSSKLDRNFVAKTHVTMAHFRQMKQEELKEAFEPLCGSRVEITVSSLLWSDRAAALAVTVAVKTENGADMPPPKNSFAHITVWHDERASAVESNDLPKLVKSGEAHQIDFVDPIRLTGVVSLWRT